MRSAILAVLAAAAGVLSVPLSAEVDSAHPPASVFYFLVNTEDAAAHIVAVDSRPTANHAVVTLTGGKGDTIVTDEAHAADVFRDGIESAFSVTVDQNLLFVVSPGSDQLSMFRIDPVDPLHPRLIRQPVNSGGNFPVSVAYSRILNKACVLNAGIKNGVQCYNVDLYKGLTPDGAFRPLGQTNQTTPPTLFTGASAISFNGDSSMLLITQKTSPVAIYPIKNGRISRQAVTSQVLPVAFGTSWVTKNTIFTTDLSFGGSLLSIGKDFAVKEVKHTDKIAELGFNCWASYVPCVNKVYTAAANASHLGIYDATTGAFDGFGEFDPALVGALDMLLDSRDDRTLWFLTETDVLVSYDAVAGKPGDTIAVNSTLVGDRRYWQGLAQWTAATGRF